MAGAFLEVKLKGTIAAGGSNTKNTVNVFHYRKSSGATTPSKVGLDASFQAVVAVPLGAALSIRWLQSQNTHRFMDDATDQELAFAHAVAGAVIGDSLPTVDSTYILLRSGSRGKNFRGNKHFGPIAESHTTAGTDDILNAGALALWNPVAAACIATINDGAGNVFTPCIISRTKSQLRYNPVVIISADITSSTLRKSIGHLRRRQVRSAY